jgi:hypothetical protein
MELEVSKFVSLHTRKKLVLTVTDVELYLALRQGALNKSPEWDGISLEFCITFRDFIKDDMLKEVKITAAWKIG